jgi:hypothetical protein
MSNDPTYEQVNQRARSRISSMCGPSPSQREGPMTVGAMRDSLREVGIDLGHEREDADDFESNCRHEAAHAACAFSLGWDVEFCDARGGRTGINPPDIMSQSINDKHLQFSVIAASAKAFTRSYCDQPFEDDRYQVRSKGHIDFETAQKEAELVAPVGQGHLQPTGRRVTRGQRSARRRRATARAG